jgi:MFS family permease
LDKRQIAPQESKKQEFFYGHFIVVAGFLVVLIANGTAYSYGVFFKPILVEFGWSRAVTSGAPSLAFILFGLAGIFMGRITDRLGPRLAVTICGLFAGLGFLLMSRVNSVWQLYLFSGVFISIGASSFVPFVSLVARWFAKRRGTMTGIVVSGVSAGIAIMPLVAGQLISSYSWRTSYSIIGSITLIIVVIIAQFLKRDPSTVGQFPYGVEDISVESLTSGSKGISIQEAIRARSFWLLSLVLFCFIFSVQAIMIHIVPHATDLGVSVTTAGGILSLIGGLGIVGRVGIGIASDRIGVKRALIIVLVLMTASIFWIITAKDLWALYLFAILFGFSFGGLITLESPLVAELFGLTSHGIILGTAILISSIGAALGILLAGRIFDVTNSYNAAFFICAGLAVIGLVLASRLKVD